MPESQMPLSEASPIHQVDNPEYSNLLIRLIDLVTHARTVDQIWEHTADIFKQIPFACAILLPTEQSLKIIYLSPQFSADNLISSSGTPERIKETSLPLPLSNLASYFPTSEPVRVSNLAYKDDTNQQTKAIPQALNEIIDEMGCDSSVFLPYLRSTLDGEILFALLLLGASVSSDAPALPEDLSYFRAILDLVGSSIYNIQSALGIQRRLVEIQSLWTVSQAISIETDLAALYQLLHNQVVNVMGELDSFAVALYDAKSDHIRIPYMYEEGQYVNIPPFPLGQGLSSIVIRSGRPLMLVEDTERKSRELGAMIIGATAKSWLGVPLMFGGETFGLLIVQDIHHEQRFNEADQRLLSTLAVQIAVVLRNATLLEATRRTAEYERIFNEIVSKIRHSGEMRTLLKTTTDELAVALGAYRAHIKISLDEKVFGASEDEQA